jgi:hypothetical protein
MFTSSSQFAINEQAGTGHNLSLSHSAAVYHMRVLSFVGECIAAQEGTSKELEAG